MNILIINYEYPPLGGGGGIFTRDLAEEFVKDHNVDIMTSRFPALKKKEAAGGINIHRTPVQGRTSLYTASLPSLVSFPFSAILKGAGLMRRNKYDIINTHFAVPTGPAGTVLSRIFNTPNVLTIHGGDLYKPGEKISPHRHALTRWAVRTVMNEAAAIIAQSSNTRDNARRLYDIRKDINIIPLGLKVPEYGPADRKSLSMKEDLTYLVSTGRLITRKAYDVLIKALAAAHKRGMELGLVLIGEGPERETLEKLSAGSGLSGHVMFTGNIPDENKFQYLSASDIYVLPSLHEGFGIVVLEAMACGLPVIATNKGGQTDIIKEPRNGLLVPPSDTEALTGAIISLASDADKRRAMSTANKEDVEKYSMHAVAERYLELFRRIISERKAG